MYNLIRVLRGSLFVFLGMLASAEAIGQSLSANLHIESVLEYVDVDAIAEDLELSENQASQLRSIVGDFTSWRRQQEADARRESTEIRDRQVKTQEEVAQSNGRPEQRVNDAWLKSKEDWEALEHRAFGISQQIVERQNAHLAEIELLLTQTQAQQFNALVRDIRRQRTIAWNTAFPEEGVDLVAVFMDTDGVSDEERDMLRPTMRRYAENLDALLQARNTLLREEPMAAKRDLDPTPIEQAFNEGQITRKEVVARRAESDAQRAERRISRLQPLMTAHRSVADVNRSWYDQSYRLLSPDSQVLVERAYWRQAYRNDRVKARLPADAFIENALGLESLTSEQSLAIAHIRDEMWLAPRRDIEVRLRSNADERTRAWESLLRKEEDHWTVARTALWKEVHAIGAQAIGQVTEVLTQTQRDQVKVPPS